MAMPQSILLALFALAVLATLGLFYSFGDRWTGLLVEFGGALLWAIVGLSAYDVRMRSTTRADVMTGEPVPQLVYLAIGLAFVVFAYFLADLVVGIGEEASEGVTEMLR